MTKKSSAVNQTIKENASKRKRMNSKRTSRSIPLRLQLHQRQKELAIIDSIQQGLAAELIDREDRVSKFDNDGSIMRSNPLQG